MLTKKNRPSRLLKNYLWLIKGSVGTKMFRRFWAEVNGKEREVLGDGQRSCAVFVSSVLVLSGLTGLIKTPHAAVTSTLKDMAESGWKKIDQPRPGAVLWWEKMKIGKRINEHLGFYIGGGRAVSNSLPQRSPAVHHWTYGQRNGKPKRKVLGIFWHDKLS